MKSIIILLILNLNGFAQDQTKIAPSHDLQLRSGFETLESFNFQSLGFGMPETILMGGDMEGNGGNPELSLFYDFITEELRDHAIFKELMQIDFICLSGRNEEVPEIFTRISEKTISLNCKRFLALESDEKIEEILNLQGMAISEKDMNIKKNCEESFATYKPIHSDADSSINFNNKKKYGSWFSKNHPNLTNNSPSKEVTQQKNRSLKKGHSDFLNLKEFLKNRINNSKINHYEKLRKVLNNETTVECADCSNLTLEGANVIAINYPQGNSGLIKLNCSLFQKLSYEKKARIVIHEYLGLSEIDDSNYQKSKYLQEQFFPKKN